MNDTVYREWDHDTLSSLATKVIIEIGTKSAFDILLRSLPKDGIPWWLEAHVGKEIQVIENGSILEHLIQAWVVTDSPIAQNFIYQCLVHMTDECVPFIIKHAVPFPQQRVRLYALHILNKFDIGQAIEGIYSLSRDRDIEIREAAIWVLAEKRDVRAIDGLARMIQYPPQIKGAEWNTSMSWIERAKNGFLLRQFLNYDVDESGFISKDSIRKEAVDLLIEIEDKQTDRILESLSKSKDSDARSWGKYGLQKRKSVAEQKETLYRVPPLRL